MPRVACDSGSHICVRARSADAIDAFHSAAVANGGHDDGRPGMRQATMIAYYAAFIRDLDGHRVEAMTVPVCVMPLTATLYVVPLPVTTAVVAPAVPESVTPVFENPVTALLNTTVKLIGVALAGSLWLAA